ncbi:DHB8-like protein [Mya arenaria]|uniref:DHB8-like protein n=1 Tax=Mya arenaria TaxID=6604 RepID=A0ABY7GAP6_MYAAR|nr:DHB8-like protein [Mya arenaria]
MGKPVFINSYYTCQIMAATGMLAGRIALVTGSGIGRAVCRVMAREGAAVAAVDLNQEAAHATIQGLPTAGSMSHQAFCADVSSGGSVSELVQNVRAAFSALPTVAVNSAGITQDAFMLKMPEERFDKVIAGTFLVNQTLARALVSEGITGASIVNIASIVGKAGVIGLTKTAAMELGRKGIRVNAVLPGFTETPMTDVIPEKVKATVTSLIPLNRMGQPEEIAEACLFLASDRASYITGAALEVTGSLEVRVRASYITGAALEVRVRASYITGAALEVRVRASYITGVALEVRVRASYITGAALEVRVRASYITGAALEVRVRASYITGAALEVRVRASYITGAALEVRVRASYITGAALEVRVRASYITGAALEVRVRASYITGAALEVRVRASYITGAALEVRVRASYITGAALEVRVRASYITGAALEVRVRASYITGAAPEVRVRASYITGAALEVRVRASYITGAALEVRVRASYITGAALEEAYQHSEKPHGSGNDYILSILTITQ